jgi:hypothetical protein
MGVDVKREIITELRDCKPKIASAIKECRIALATMARHVVFFYYACSKVLQVAV